MSSERLDLVLVLARAIRRGASRGMPRGELTRQLAEMGTRSLLLVVGGMAFLGAVMMAHAASQARRVVQDLAVVGPPWFELLLRTLGPTIGGLLAAIRLGSSVSAEVASMQVSEQVDALRMSAGDPYSDIVLPRLVSGAIAVPSLIIGGTMAAAVSAALAATYLYHADGGAFLDASLVDGGDLLAFLAKSVLYGIIIPLTATASGLGARGGPAAVGRATTSGVVSACIGILVVDLLVSLALLKAGV